MRMVLREPLISRKEVVAELVKEKQHLHKKIRQAKREVFEYIEQWIDQYALILCIDKLNFSDKLVKEIRKHGIRFQELKSKHLRGK